MIRDRVNFLSHMVRASSLVVCGLLVLFWAATSNAQSQKSKAKMVNAYAAVVQQPIYREYRGVRLGMTTEEARAKLGEPEQKSDDQDFYVFSDKEIAQIAYNAAHEVVTISVDYMGGLGAPDYRSVVGTELEVRAAGSMYKMVRYESERFWVSYNKSAGAVTIVTITLQRMK